MKISKTKHITKDGVVKRNPKKSNSSSKIVTYAGHWIWSFEGKIVPMDFSLYNEENIDVEETKSQILDNMNKNHLKKLKSLFAMAGLLLHELTYYSPNYYNYEGDSLDLKISIADKSKLKRFVLSQKAEIQRMLDSNKSYNGYISLTKDSIEEIFEEIDEKGEVDVMVITYILSKYPLDMYKDFYDLFYYDEDEDEE